ncbi:hypothetical protein BAY61_31010 [Prauserella marina]|uniref:2-phosphosulfolactate phosphatase n=1 Tax=Prauserella marina TaxID=530584 RepID=A0A222VXP2_9PSEU|nr:2-phosphosulfolactate phosphatase [Prauserella marina]ASR38699.1 hypothetical protein BAY61_31010 [Prauserella marina]PWV82036.1 2-phosphosulfolactate phosphatase [Prauserella marina]SDD17993.1 2-phosphosulfolactate phosphatase [Prauserella marina]
MSPFSQHEYQVRCEWGLAGAREITRDAAITAVVDVLSFTTTLTVAADRGVAVFPYPWRDSTAAEFARSNDAVLAVGRSRAGFGEVSLSPETVRSADGLSRLVLPSPNGATIARAVARTGSQVIGVSLRNAKAAAAWTVGRLATMGLGSPVTVIAAGEQWADGALRPAIEDLWGAGAFIEALAASMERSTPEVLSPEARGAVAAYRDVAPELPGRLHDCASGRDLVASGFAGDVEVAGEVDQSDVVPVLHDAVFRTAPP